MALAQEDNYRDVEDTDNEEIPKYKKESKKNSQATERKMMFRLCGPACRRHATDKETAPKIRWNPIWIDFWSQEVKTRCEV